MPDFESRPKNVERWIEMRTNDKWITRWAVRSRAGHGDYIVGKDAEGNWGCSCVGWTMHAVKKCSVCGLYWAKGEIECSKCGSTATVTLRKDCYHITEVKGGRGRSIAEAILDRMKGR